MIFPVPSDLLILRFGSTGTQTALVVRTRPDSALLIRKWHKMAHRWTTLTRIRPAAVLRFAGPDDERAYSVKVPEQRHGTDPASPAVKERTLTITTEPKVHR